MVCRASICKLNKAEVVPCNCLPEITIIGGGLAGCEAAWQAAQRGCQVTIHEMKPVRFSPAHESVLLAELVCSNSLRAADDGDFRGHGQRPLSAESS